MSATKEPTYNIPNFPRLAEQAICLRNARFYQVGGKAAATQRKLEAMFRDNPGLDAYMKAQAQEAK